MTKTGPIPQPDSAARFIGLTDEQVLERAKAALRLLTSHRIGSNAREAQWEDYAAAKAELDRRLLNHVLRKLGERGTERRPES